MPQVNSDSVQLKTPPPSEVIPSAFDQHSPPTGKELTEALQEMVLEGSPNRADVKGQRPDSPPPRRYEEQQLLQGARGRYTGKVGQAPSLGVSRKSLDRYLVKLL